MKPPRSKPHLLISDEPLTAGKDYVSLCGVKVKNAGWVFMWDVDGMGTYDLSLGSMCQNCCQVLDDSFARYIYGAIDGELLHQEQTL